MNVKIESLIDARVKSARDMRIRYPFESVDDVIAFLSHSYDVSKFEIYGVRAFNMTRYTYRAK